MRRETTTSGLTDSPTTRSTTMSSSLNSPPVEVAAKLLPNLDLTLSQCSTTVSTTATCGTSSMDSQKVDLEPSLLTVSPTAHRPQMIQLRLVPDTELLLSQQDLSQR